MTFLPLIGLIPLLPLAGFLVNGLAGKRWLPRHVVAAVACGTVLLSLLLSIGAVRELSDPALMAAATPVAGMTVNPDIPRVGQVQWHWLATGSLSVDWSYSVDPLTAVMLLVVTGVGFLIHVYSIGYMAHEEGFARFFAYLNLFMAMMLVLVLADSFLVLFVGWEGVGLCSYLLIGFNYRDMFDANRGMSCADAGRKAFLVNRIGDYGFMMGMLLIWTTFGTLSFTPIFAAVPQLGAAGSGLLTVMALLLFVGATGKSAQVPLFVWLPDAMAGPTPVSALIHAATMVTAGVYMVCRCATLFAASPVAMATVAGTGALTAIFAAIIGCTQFDIKKILAYSTISQLGYMFLAAGVGAFSFAIFHVMTHAFFKALLFLGAGSVIHGMSGEQDIRKMGRVSAAMPWTSRTFVIAAAAIAGVPPLAGFFSKDSILGAAFARRPDLWAIGAFTAALTAFYIWRLVFLTFFGTDRVEKSARRHLHESPGTMVIPLAVLAGLSVMGGFASVPEFLAGPLGMRADALAHWLAPVFEEAGVGDGMGGALAGQATGGGLEWGLMLLSVVLGLLGIGVAYRFYARESPTPARLAASLGRAYRLAADRFRIDELYEAAVLRPYRLLCRSCEAVDRFVIDLAVNTIGIFTEIGGHALKLFQTGSVRSYALSFFLGVVVLLGCLMFL
ncbi:MAG: NADH-quinone oxidoreductase subunit L [Acidobacteriota bacterium]